MTTDAPVTTEEVALILEAFPEITSGPEMVAWLKEQLLPDLVSKELAWGWVVAQLWVCTNLLELIQYRHEAKNLTWDAAFMGSLDAVRAGMEIYNGY